MWTSPKFFYDSSSAGGASAPGGTSDSTDYKGLYQDLKNQIDTGKFIAMERYAGLQQVLEKERLAKETLGSKVNDLTGQLGDLTTAKSTIEGQLVALQSSVQELTTYKTTAETKLAEDDTKIKRYEVLVQKFPELVPFEAKKLLPQAATDQLETVFSNFKSTIEEIQKAAGKQYVQGSSPESPTSPTSSVPADKAVQIKGLRDTAREHARKGEQKEYDIVMAQVRELEKP